MQTAEIYVSIYSAYRLGIPGKHGPENLKTYIGLAGVSELSTRPEFMSVLSHISAEHGKIGIDKEVGGIGSPPYRKKVTIALPQHVHYGSFKFAKRYLNGLYCDYSSNDGMGPIVDVFCNSTVLVTGTWEDAIDAAIASGITLNVPTESKVRKDVPVKILHISPIFGDVCPE